MNSSQQKIKLTHLILASASPRRKEILEEANIPIKVISPDIPEKDERTGDPAQIAIHNAELKAKHIADKYPQELVLAADTVVALDDQIFHKPKDLSEAKSMLQAFSGKCQMVYTGICFYAHNLSINESFSAISYVNFKCLDDGVIKKYHELVDPLDRAGGWSIQDHAELVVESYTGSFTNIAGLPIEAIQEWIQARNIEFSEKIS